MIYKYVLLSEEIDTGMFLSDRTLTFSLSTERRASSMRLSNRRRRALDRTKSSLALLFICRQIQMEASPIYYGLNTFHFHCATVVRVFQRAICSANFNSIRCVHLSEVDSEDMWRILRSMPVLKHVRIELI